MGRIDEGMKRGKRMLEFELLFSFSPLFNTACHSLSLFSTGNDMFLDELLLNKEPKKGIVGIERRTDPLDRKGCKVLDRSGRDAPVVLFVKV